MACLWLWVRGVSLAVVRRAKVILEQDWSAEASTGHGCHGASASVPRRIVMRVRALGVILIGVALGLVGRTGPVSAACSPSSGTWTQLSSTGAPPATFEGSAVWTGQSLLVYGGYTVAFGFHGPSAAGAEGGLYNPATDSWTTFPPAAGDLTDLVPVWTGGSLVFANSTGYWSFSPSQQTWTKLPSEGAPPVGAANAAAWTGSEVVFWGGSTPGGAANGGGAFDPTTDSWRPLSTQGAPSGRYNSGSVWTRSEMFVWGGERLDQAHQATLYLGDGALYDPRSDSWTPVSAAGAPSAREYPQTLWTGSQVIVWGGDGLGSDGRAETFEDGALYDPATDTWSPLSPVGEPAFSWGKKSPVWDGSGMLVLGGDGVVYRYDPAANVWQTEAADGGPTPRTGYMAVWDGSGLLIWGGEVNNGPPYSVENELWRYAESESPSSCPSK